MTAVPYRPLYSFAHYRNKLGEEGHCRMCLRPAHVRPLTRHHLIPQRWFARQRHDVRWQKLRNCAANIIPLCRACHDEVERDRESRRMLRRSLVQEEIAWIIAVRGTEWLNTRYPS